MNSIQRLFELMAGISQEERDRWALSKSIYAAPRVDVLALHTPACWRRKANVRRVKR
jgi:hypothetical protein